MSNLVKQSQLSEVALELWRRIKNRYNGAFINARYEEVTQKLILTPVEGAEVEVDLTDLASKTLDNYFEGDNTFKDISLGLPYVVDVKPQGGTDTGAAPNQIKTGNRAVNSHAQNSNGYVKNLVIRINDSANVGNDVSVNIWEVTKGVTKDLDVPKQLYSNLTLKIADGSNYFTNSKVAICPINKKYNEETYFIYEVIKPEAQYRVSNATPSGDDYIFISQDDDVTQQNIAKSPNYMVGIHLLELGNVSIGDLISSGGNGTVTSVNGRTPNDLGEVTVDAEHINYNNAQVGLGGVTVQDAIKNLNDKFGNYVPTNDVTTVGGNAGADKVVRLDGQGLLHIDMLPKVATSEYYEVQDMPAAEAQKANCQNGDVIKITGTNKTYLCIDATKQNFNDAFMEISPQAINVGVTDVEYREANQELIVTKQGGAQTYSLSELNTKVNGIAPIAGNVTINASEIYLKDKPAQSIEDELKTKLVSINSQTGIDGNVNLSLRIVADNLEFKAENTPIDTLELYTDAEANTLIQYFN